LIFFIFFSFLLLYLFFIEYFWIGIKVGNILIFLSIYFTPIFFITLLIFSFYLLLYSFNLFFHYINFSTQIGCCKPPLRCGFTKKNATFWEAPKAGPLANDTDCRTWSNRQDKLCFNCDSCKGGVLANIRSQWRHLTIFNTCVLVLVTTIYVLGCYAIRNNRLEYSNYTTQRKIRMRIPSTVIWPLKPYMRFLICVHVTIYYTITSEDVSNAVVRILFYFIFSFQLVNYLINTCLFLFLV